MQASNYKIMIEYIIRYIKKIFKYGQDIVTALKDFKEFDLDAHKPTLL